MATSADLRELAATFRQLATTLPDRDATAVVKAVGVKLAKEVDAPVAMATGGDGRMSGWATDKIVAKSYVRKSGTGFVAPTPRTRGPMRVLEDGRNDGRSTPARAGRRWNGRTRGKGTWTAAETRMEQVAPELFVAEVTRIVEGKLGG